jgi:hypothetical protein
MDILTYDQIKQLKIEEKITYSWKGPILGTFLFGGWGYLIYFLHQQKDFPRILVTVQLLAIGIFLWMLARQIQSILKGKIPFLIAQSRNTLLIPLNHSIKRPKDELNLFLSLEAQNIQSLRLYRETRSIFHLHPGARRNRTRILISHYLEIRLTEKTSDTFYKKIEGVIRQEGFCGCPLYPKDSRTLQYFIIDHEPKIQKLSDLLRRCLF